MDNILRVDDLTINIKTQHGTVQAVRNVSFSLAIVGESGSGKSITVADKGSA